MKSKTYTYKNRVTIDGKPAPVYRTNQFSQTTWVAHASRLNFSPVDSFWLDGKNGLLVQYLLRKVHSDVMGLTIAWDFTPVHPDYDVITIWNR